LFGAGLGVAWSIIGRAADMWAASRGGALNIGDAVFLTGFRHSLGRVAVAMPDSVRTALIFFLLIFLLRAVLRNRWIAGAAFVAIFVTMRASQSDRPEVSIAETALTYGIAAVVVERLGLLSLAVGVFVDNLLANLPITLNASAPYFGEMALVLAIALAVCVWAFHTSTAGRRLWSGSLFE